MYEELIQFVWKYKMYVVKHVSSDLTTVPEVIEPGIANADAGPDFFNAKIKIEDKVWAGNIEIHEKASMWYKHHHHTDMAYSNVILHVVLHNDQQVLRSNGEPLSTIEIEILPEIIEKYRYLTANVFCPACVSKKIKYANIVWMQWLSQVMVQRLEAKSELIKCRLADSDNDWDSCFYADLLRNFGFGKNSENFEWVAASLPYRVLLKHADNCEQIEAMLFGQAGWLVGVSAEPQMNIWQREYKFLASKYNLMPSDHLNWKFARMRPCNFPTFRMAQFASLFGSTQSLLSRVLECSSLNGMVNIFKTELKAYWHTHYRPGVEAKPHNATLGIDAIHRIIGNTVVPYLFTWGKYHAAEEMCEKALALLEQLPPEQNRVLSLYSEIDVVPANALESQALNWLNRTYCEKQLCVKCRIGQKYLIDKNGWN